MRSGVIAQKLGMTRVYNDAGEHVPVTVLRMENCHVVAQRTVEKNGYTAVQLGVGIAKVKNTSKAMRGHFAKAEVEPRNICAVSASASVTTAASVTNEECELMTLHSYAADATVPPPTGD